MDNVVILPVVTRLPIPVERILDQAAKADLNHAVVIGWDKQGQLYFASSEGSGPEVIWLLEKAKIELLKI